MLLRVSRAGLLAGVFFACAPFGAAMLQSPPAQAQDALRPVVGKPLQKAQALAKAGKFPAAMEQIDIAERARDKTANESFVIDEMRASVAQQSGDFKSAIGADDVLLKSGRVPAAEQQRLLMAEASSYYQMRDYAGTIAAIDRYHKAGGASPALETLLIQCYYLQKDYVRAAAVQNAQIQAELKARQTPPEAQLQLLANCQLQSRDTSGLDHTMTLLVTYYPKPEYWAQLMQGLRANPNVPDRLQFDIDRLRLDVGLLTSTQDFMDMAEMAVQDGLPNQGLAVMNKGYATGALGRDAQAPREARLKALVDKTVAEKKASIATDEASARSQPNGNALLAVGYSYVDLGQYPKGIAVMKEAIAKGGLLNPEDAQLHLGLAEMAAGDKAAAGSTLQGVSGTDGAADIAQLWLLRMKA
ncbi:tetratricopeptide repeat protein [Lichenicoccus roseus]|uniref:Tetratricopeptide repeat protein n=1 Tax=Lichenicoccus roseus TaxID=2683649 RepID=A0A5R9JC97_9PROT|nr:tetratricopeptide repeat protein [Lichenicoccus roseus]TLU74383.1 hypothetical protein FE263_04155 [Lichenicoccus roseus]